MNARHFVSGILVGCLLSALLGAALPAGSGGDQPVSRLALQQLQSDFHEAGVIADEGMMRSLWADDATFTYPGGTIEGGDAIAAFFASSPLWGDQVALSPSYKSQYEIQGNRAEFVFECVLVHVTGEDPLTMSLADAAGRQDEDAEIVQHTQATGLMERIGNRWVFKEFTGQLMPTGQ